MMAISTTKLFLFTVLCCVFVSASHAVDYSYLVANAVNCSERDSCNHHNRGADYMDRSCECDPLCRSYDDCCINANVNRSVPSSLAQTNTRCMHYGIQEHTGVYAISRCSNSWRGNRKIREKCIGPVDYSDPLNAAPVTDVTASKTYRNRYCAECNNADMASLTTFQIRLPCDGVHGITEEQILADLTYNRSLNLWGVHRLNRFGNATEFIGCEVIFDVPDYINNSVRFCRSNIISRCSPHWNRLSVASACAAYMAVTYDGNFAYRNPHCAICNYKNVSEISCRTNIISRKRPISFAILLDVNQSDGDEVGMRRVATPECASGHKYDPFFKRCRKLVCALPGHVVVNGKCVRS